MINLKGLPPLFTVGAIMMLAGCAGQPKKADGGYEYTTIKPAKEIVVPAKLAKPISDRQYQIEHKKPVNGKVGEAVSIFPPRLVAPIVTASHIDELDPRTTIWFEQTEQVKDLEEAIWNAVRGYLNKQDVEVARFAASAGVLESEWFNISREEGWGFWKDERVIDKQKYRFWVKMKPHRRSGSLTVELVERQPLVDDYAKYVLTDDVALATEMLNSVVGHFEYRLRLDAENRRVQYVKGIVASLATAPNGDPAVLIDAPYEHSWIRMIEALDYYELLLTDVNKIQGRIHARVKRDNSGFWSGLFGNGDDAFGLEKGDYVIELIRQEAQTYVVINDLTLTPVEKSQLEKILPKLKERLAENLD
ncbi:outer membrane protein assembly factor BamC [Catenovulum sediminis]|uniref:Outer membrane protein assembly factor BamC n=1 Tax=Catenovulum sediminis TaxID=1740262 RepID=A0ABV1RH12_9ALTE|nr:outer membrane protein assembly factor BamC [Catenovulum sediminis]